jgi:hypothetical protein
VWRGDSWYSFSRRKCGDTIPRDAGALAPGFGRSKGLKPPNYLAVVLEKGQIVDCGLDPQDEAELVLELQRHRPHGVFDPRSLDADVETFTVRPRKVTM